MFAKTVGFSSRFTGLSDQTKSDIVKDITNPTSTIRSIFEEDTLDLHPNVNRINKALKLKKSSKEYEELKNEIIKVDTFRSYMSNPAEIRFMKNSTVLRSQFVKEVKQTGDIYVIEA